MLRQDFGVQRTITGGTGKHHARTGRQLLPGMHERIPSVVIQLRKQQTLSGAAARYARAEQARGKHFRIVDNQDVAFTEQIREARHVGVLDLAGASAQHEQLRRTSLGRSLRNEPGG